MRNPLHASPYEELGIASLIAQNERVARLFGPGASREQQREGMLRELAPLVAAQPLGAEQVRAFFTSRGALPSSRAALDTLLAATLPRGGALTVEQLVVALQASYAAELQAVRRLHGEEADKMQQLKTATRNREIASRRERRDPASGFMMDNRNSVLARLEVSLLEARNLPSMKYPKGTSDIMVEAAVEPIDAADDTPVCGEPCVQKSDVERETLNPRWSTPGTADGKGQHFVFRPVYRRDAQLVLRVYDKDSVLADDLLIGVVRIKLEAFMDQLKHSGWHSLQASVEQQQQQQQQQGGVALRTKGSVHISVQFLYSQEEYFLRVVGELRQACAGLGERLGAARQAVFGLQGLFAGKAPRSFFGRVSRAAVSPAGQQRPPSPQRAPSPLKQPRAAAAAAAGSGTSVIAFPAGAPLSLVQLGVVAGVFAVLAIFVISFTLSNDWPVGLNPWVTDPGEV